LFDVRIWKLLDLPAWLEPATAVQVRTPALPGLQLAADAADTVGGLWLGTMRLRKVTKTVSFVHTFQIKLL